MNETKSGQRHDRKAGQAYGLAAPKLFSVLMLFTFCLFLMGVHELALLGLWSFFVSRQKRTSPAAIERRVYSMKEEVKVKIPPR
jgi:hypothetical protein